MTIQSARSTENVFHGGFQGPRLALIAPSPLCIALPLLLVCLQCYSAYKCNDERVRTYIRECHVRTYVSSHESLIPLCHDVDQIRSGGCDRCARCRNSALF